MELKSMSGTMVKNSAKPFNRTNFGIENSLSTASRYIDGSFNRTNFGIENTD